MPKDLTVHLSAALSSPSKFPNGDPIAVEKLADGASRYTMEDGRLITVSTPNYTLQYESSWVGSTPGEYYEVPIALSGAMPVAGYFEAWNFEINALRHYAFSKTIRVISLTDGESFTGMELYESLKTSQTC